MSKMYFPASPDKQAIVFCARSEEGFANITITYFDKQKEKYDSIGITYPISKFSNVKLKLKHSFDKTVEVFDIVRSLIIPLNIGVEPYLKIKISESKICFCIGSLCGSSPSMPHIGSINQLTTTASEPLIAFSNVGGKSLIYYINHDHVDTLISEDKSCDCIPSFTTIVYFKYKDIEYNVQDTSYGINDK